MSEQDSQATPADDTDVDGEAVAADDTDVDGEAVAADDADVDGEAVAADESVAAAEFEAVDGDELAVAIEENPEAVARFVERLDAVNDLLDVVELGMGAMDDEMAESIAGTGGTLAASADGLATRDTVALAESVGANGGELADALETVVALQRSGTLDDLAALADLTSLASGALDDEMVETLAARGTALGELADTAAEPETVSGLETLLEAVGDASSDDPEAVGVVGALRATRDPDVRTGLGYLLGLAKALGAGVRSDGESVER